MLYKTKAAALTLPVQIYKLEIEVFGFSLSYDSGSYLWRTDPAGKLLSSFCPKPSGYSITPIFNECQSLN